MQDEERSSMLGGEPSSMPGEQPSSAPVDAPEPCDEDFQHEQLEDERSRDEQPQVEQPQDEQPQVEQPTNVGTRAPWGLNRTQLLCASAAAALCLVLIAGSVWSLLSGGGTSLTHATSPQGSAVEADEGSGQDQAGKDGSASEPSVGDEGSAEGTSAGDAAAGDASDASHATSGGASASGQTSSAGGNAGASSGDGSSDSGQSSGSTSSQSPAQPAPRTVAVTISADGSLGGGGAAGPVTLTFEEGATVYDALASSGWSVLADWGAMGAYVTSINGVAAGPNTGWTYTVNGSMPNYACSSYTLADGDVISWRFVEVR